MKRSELNKYSVSYVDYPIYPEIRKFISPTEKMIYVNTASHPDAKTIFILPPGAVLEM